ncbi:MAG: glutamate synthase-related protein [Methanomassiliicoccales archaeon]|jgi:ferredoxin
MYERYHIHQEVTAPRFRPVPKFIIERAGNCINCGKCERNCVYGVHMRREDDPRQMAEPLSQFCKDCFRCIAGCPQRALTISVGAEFRSLGSGGWTPQRISTVWNESETGKVPVFGAGYRGMFSGPGYDAMWTDMSEIVRPTRDGIHGREHISTNVLICRNPPFLEFGPKGELLTPMAESIDLPVPFVFDLSELKKSALAIMQGLDQAAKELHTLLMVPVDKVGAYGMDLSSGRVVPIVGDDAGNEVSKMPEQVRFIELADANGLKERVKAVRAARSGMIVGTRVKADAELESRLVDIAREADVIHVLFDEEGREPGGRYARDALRAYHKALVKAGVRDEVTIIAGGGIAAAEQVPKSIICGTDVVSLDDALMVSLGCRMCPSCKDECPADLANAPSEYVKGRVVNMGNAWRDQLLEVLGAMGIKEVRRLRGETGRAIFQEDAERDSFAGIFRGDVIG